MKTKKISKKLTLNKKTIADLNSNEMKGVHGGVLESANTNCASCVITGCGPCETDTACTFTCQTCQTCPTYDCYTRVTGNPACQCWH